MSISHGNGVRVRLLKGRRKAKVMRCLMGVAATVYAGLFGLDVLIGHYGHALTKLLLCWIFYRLFLSARRSEAYWMMCLDQLTRAKEESEDKLLWHLEQIESALHEMQHKFK